MNTASYPHGSPKIGIYPTRRPIKKYNDGITWKRAAHEKFGTRLITTSSVDFYRSDIRETLKQLLLDAGVPLQERTDTELYSMVLPEGSKQEKAFIRLIATFVTLLKSSCRSLKDVLKQTDEANDRRSEFVVKKHFPSVYERYAEALRSGGQIDFYGCHLAGDRTLPGNASCVV